jgi:ABC-type multidrug transport system ATPase subunit/pSer/pThr/pTyr-binding forkhead associated (FHA) protein
VIQVGSLIQIGAKGPILGVELTEPGAAVRNFSETLVDATAAKQQAALRTKIHEGSQPHTGTSKTLVDQPVKLEPTSGLPPSLSRPPQRAEIPAARAVPTAPPMLVCESGSATQTGRHFILANEKTLLGRDVSVDIVIDAAAAAVSRRHAEINRQADGAFVIIDLKSFNGTLLNQQLISQPEKLYHGDGVQLGTGGPILRFVNPSDPLRRPASTPSLAGADSPGGQPSGRSGALDGSRTLVYRMGAEHVPQPTVDATGAQLLFRRNFDGKQKLSVGRGSDNDIQLDGLLISKYHARFLLTAQGVSVEEAGSANGVYVNGGRVSGRQSIGNDDVVQIGPFVLRLDPPSGIAVFDTRAKTRIDAIGISQTVGKAGQGRKLLDEISLAISANEFVGVLGPSGAGKSTLINALNGTRRTSSGQVLINNLELYQHIDSLKQSLGYVPQDDIIHRQLTVYRTLYYVARLRLSSDVHRNEIDQIIAEVLEVTGLTARRDVLVSQLSGGQRKRVSIAVELITKPSVIFLDEPTSGLDPAAEERTMKLFRQIAESGRTVILTTHAMENVRLFDKVVLLMGGKLIFYGAPADALEFVGAANFIELYNKLEEPVEVELAKIGPLPARASKQQRREYDLRRAALADEVSENWRRKFTATKSHRLYIAEPLSQVQQSARTLSPPRRRRSVSDALLQWTTLVRRYAEVLFSDRSNLLILFGQAPIIGLLTYLVVGKNDPRDFPFFILALVAVWFGTSVAAREIVKERPIFRRERMVNLRLLPYVASKLLVLSFLVTLQATILFGALKILHFAGLMYLPGVLLGVPQLLVLALTGVVGIALGLFISAVVKTSETATSLVPLILIPQILFAGLVGVPSGVSKIVGAAMPATWSFDEIKRLSTLDTLKMEGSQPSGPNQGRGLYDHVKDLNEENVRAARQQVADYREQTKKSVEDYTRGVSEQMRGVGGPVSTPSVGPPPAIPDAVEIEKNLSEYVSFLHPWGSHIVDVAALFVMLFGLVIANLIALKTRDTG